MKRINILCIILFIFSVSAFTVYAAREFMNRDNLGPVITIESDEITVSVNATEEELLKGVTAVDAKDGDVTGSIVIESISEFVEDNVRFVNYAAFDKDNHVSKASRKIIYSDYTTPKFELGNPLRFSVSTSTKNILSNLKVKDCLDGDISDKVNFSADTSIIMSIASEYPVRINVSNSAGDSVEFSATVTVYDNVKENMAPQIELKKYLVYTTVGEKLDAKSYLKKVSYRGTEYKMTDGTGTYGTNKTLAGEQTVSYDDIAINDNVDYSKAGSYEIEYVMNDEEGNRGSVRLIVIVEGEKDGAAE